MRCLLLLGSGLVLDASLATAKSYTRVIYHRIVVDDGFIDIRVVDDRGVHPDHCGVVSKIMASPLAAGKADAHVAEAVIHAAVVADVIAPVAIVEYI